MDDKIRATLDKVIQLSQYNQEFGENLRKRLNVVSASSVLSGDERIEQIYEYCIEKIIRQQAFEFYYDFPLQSVKEDLIEDFVRMESFRRKNNFGDFCLALYQQIECMTNRLCEKREMDEITETMWGHPAYIKIEKGKDLDISNRGGDYNIASLLFPGTNKQSGNSHAFEKSRKSLQSQYAIDKIRVVVYFLGYKAMMKSSDYDSFVEITSLLSDIYQCRNMNHRGNSLNQWEKETFERIIPLQSLYYFKFMGVLAQYVEFVKLGYSAVNDILKYCKTITPKKIQGGSSLKILGSIPLEKL